MDQELEGLEGNVPRLVLDRF